MFPVKLIVLLGRKKCILCPIGVKEPDAKTQSLFYFEGKHTVGDFVYTKR
jgi:hypothetical protein